MFSNTFGGLFVAVDGANGAGKTTLIKRVMNKLKEENISVYSTHEPSNSQLGNFVRSASEREEGKSLACLMGADRYRHLEKEIIPRLEAGDIVITDRYVLSSLIYQRMDKVDVNFILDINKEILIPDIYFAVMASDNIIEKRLRRRNKLTRFEGGEHIKEELRYLEEGIDIMKGLGIPVIKINNSGKKEKNTQLVYSYIKKEYEGIRDKGLF